MCCELPARCNKKIPTETATLIVSMQGNTVHGFPTLLSQNTTLFHRTKTSSLLFLPRTTMQKCTTAIKIRLTYSQYFFFEGVRELVLQVAKHCQLSLQFVCISLQIPLTMTVG